MQQIARWKGARVLAVLCIGLSTWTDGLAQNLTWLGTLGGDWSEARAISADGSLVVGIAVDSLSRYRAFRWTANSGMQDLGTLGGRNSMAYSVSADGTKVVGISEVNANGEERATLWVNGNIIDLGTLPFSGSPPRSGAYAISADGNVVVGYSYSDLNQWGGAVFRACRWDISNTPFSIEQLDNHQLIGPNRRRATGVGSCAHAVSANGRAITGRWGYGWGIGGFYWNDDASNPDPNPSLNGDKLYQLRGLLNGYGHFGRGVGYGMSADGRVAVGYATDALLNIRPARWVYDPVTHQLSGPEFLGSFGGVFGLAHASNADGSVIVGWQTRSDGQGRAFIWTVQGGMRDLNSLYANLLTDGSILERAYAITPDGRYIVGIGYRAQTRQREAYLLDTAMSYRQQPGDVNRDGCVDEMDLMMVLFNFGATGQHPADVNQDGIVDDADVAAVLLAFGNGC